ncbi:MAG: transposase [Acidimicrobiia bacterium]|nr:transposase [Acidimicrobiia bacterium]
MSMVGVTGGVDTHADVHVAAAVDHNGGWLGVESLPADLAGYESLVGWLAGFGPISRIGVEGTGSWGVGLARFLGDQDIEVIEVDRSNRQIRRKQGKSDPTDAVSAARAALSDPFTKDRRPSGLGRALARTVSLLRLSDACKHRTTREAQLMSPSTTSMDNKARDLWPLGRCAIE